MTKHINIAIDGPSGAGKSTVAKQLSDVLGISYVDTGAIYRTIGYAVKQSGISPDDSAAVEKLLPSVNMDVKFENGKQLMILDGENLGDKIRQNDISTYASKVSAIPAVRTFLLDTQRKIAAENSVVMDGRDIGTVILPNADVKIFLTATAEERAERRYLELVEKGMPESKEKILADIIERDRRDSERAIAPLKPAADAVLMDNSGISLEGFLDMVLDVIYSKVPEIKEQKTGD